MFRAKSGTQPTTSVHAAVCVVASLLSIAGCAVEDSTQSERIGASPVFDEDQAEEPGYDELDGETLAQAGQRISSDGGPICGDSGLESCEHRTSTQSMMSLYFREGSEIARVFLDTERRAGGRLYHFYVAVYFEFETRRGEVWEASVPLASQDTRYVFDRNGSVIGVEAWMAAEWICASILHRDVQAYLGSDFTNEVRFRDVILDPAQGAPRIVLRRNLVTCN